MRSTNFLMLEESATISGSDSALYTFNELSATFQNAARGLFNHLGRILVVARGEALKLCFVLGCEMHFQAKQRAVWRLFALTVAAPRQGKAPGCLRIH